MALAMAHPKIDDTKRQPMHIQSGTITGIIVCVFPRYYVAVAISANNQCVTPIIGRLASWVMPPTA